MSHVNPNHGYDGKSKEYIDRWDKAQLYNEEVKKYLLENKLGGPSDTFNHSHPTIDPNKIRSYNLARNKIINGLTQFFDGIGEIISIDNSFVIDSDFMNLCGIIAFSKSSANDNIKHWAKAEKEYQLAKQVDLPGSTSKKGKSEKIERPEEYESAWYGIQFLYRQLEVFRYVPNYDIVAGIWDLIAKKDKEVVQILDHWYYLHNSQISKTEDLSSVIKGYFFRYNAKMTTAAQAETLYILNSLFSHSGAKPFGTTERPPWFPDALIGKTLYDKDDIPNSSNIIPHNVDKRKIDKLKESPIVGKSLDGMMTLPSEPERAKDFEDKEIQNVVGKHKSMNKKELAKEIAKKEVPRKGEKGYFKGKDGTRDQHWDQDDSQSFDNGVELPGESCRGANGEISKPVKESKPVKKPSPKVHLEELELSRNQGSLFVDEDQVIQKIVDGDGEEVRKLTTDKGKVYKIGMSM